ncbi:MAG: hypothetical protein ONB46_20735 [candidate division KSB1 bacterium]|nr:hypothetical protein [candidate division KSB1 bacterium]MDZ7368216.1 hypothetical protein [candidate division KSB1 bacterium]MDZ7403946.1 hypothetical protein [candidate division KSB1 bacterium]
MAINVAIHFEASLDGANWIATSSEPPTGDGAQPFLSLLGKPAIIGLSPVPLRAQKPRNDGTPGMPVSFNRVTDISEQRRRNLATTNGQVGKTNYLFMTATLHDD